jgi:hypothetical protein
MSRIAVTVDLDWACEAAIEETLDFLDERQVLTTVFATHRSARVEASLGHIEVGLHPYFGEDSSHGRSIGEVVRSVLDLPHNLAAFRCHRYASCNAAREALAGAGLWISSNVCTDLESVAPFQDRYGATEVPIFMEDGGYLLREHALDGSGRLKASIREPGAKVFVVHPMHFAINTPHFGYMANIKRSMSREAWNHMTPSTLDRLRWKGRGIRDLVVDVINGATEVTTIGAIAQQRSRRA